MNDVQYEKSMSMQEYELSEEIYHMALIGGQHESIIDTNGKDVNWLLDLRLPLLDGRIANRLGQVIANRLRSQGCLQVAGYGFGGNAMVCAVINCDGNPPLLGGFIRSHRKPHGRQRIIEGPLDTHAPVVLLDDLLNSGKTALYAIGQLRNEGFDVTGCYTVFEYTWGRGRTKLEKEGLWVDTLMELTITQDTSQTSEPALRR